MGQVLGVLQYQVAQRLTGRLPWRILDERWEHTLAEAVREEAGFEPMETYIHQSRNTFAQYILMQPIMYLCKAAERK